MADQQPNPTSPASGADLSEALSLGRPTQSGRAPGTGRDGFQLDEPSGASDSTPDGAKAHICPCIYYEVDDPDESEACACGHAIEEHPDGPCEAEL